MLSKSQQELAAAHEGLICKVIRQLRADCSEYYGLGALALCKAALHYDPSRGAAFYTYASCAVRNAVLQAMRDEKAAKRRINRRTVTVYMDEYHVLRPVCELIPGEKDMEEKCIGRITLARMLNQLSVQEQITAVMLSEGAGLTEISRILKVSRQRVFQIKKSIKEKLQKNFDLREAWQKRISNYFSQYDSMIQIINPFNFYSISDRTEDGLEREIREYYLYRLSRSDLVIVNFQILDPIGAAQELAMAAEHKIPVIGFNENELKNHPWLTLCCSKIFRNLGVLAEYVHYYYLT